MNVEKKEDLFVPNTDPNRRLITISTVSQRTAVANDCGLMKVTMKEVNSLLPNPSEAIKRAFDHETFLDYHVIVMIYEDLKGVMKRRVMMCQRPDNTEEWRTQVVDCAASLGIKLNMHKYEPKVGMVKEAKPKPKAVKSNLIFFYDLIEQYDGTVTAPLTQLAKVSKKINHVSAIEEENHSSMIVAEFLSKYLNSDKECYYKIADQFGKHLAKSSNQVSTKYLPIMDRTIFVEFPITFKSGHYFIKNSFIKIGLNHNDRKIMTLVMPIYDSEMNWTQGYNFMNLDIGENDDVKAAFEDALNASTNEDQRQVAEEFDSKIVKQETNEILTYCAKCVIYIHSAEPNLVREPGKKSDKKNPVKLKKFYKVNNPFDVTNVGYSFHGRNYHVDETIVTGHARWQPCGVNKSEVKLIWINEHKRVYNKNKEDVHK